MLTRIGDGHTSYYTSDCARAAIDAYLVTPRAGQSRLPDMTAHPAAAANASATLVRTRMRRRPSGEPPPLPRRINTSGRWWLALAVVVVVFWVVAAMYRGLVVRLDVIDHAILDASRRCARRG